MFTFDTVLSHSRSVSRNSSCEEICPVINPWASIYGFRRYVYGFYYKQRLLKHVLQGGGAFLLITAGKLSFENSLVVELLFIGRGDPGVSSFVKVGVCVVGATFGSNVVLCFLIVVRLHYHQKNIESVLGKKRGSPYRRIMVLCVESCAFIVAIVFLGGILWGAAGLTYSIIALLLLPQACVSPVYTHIMDKAQYDLPWGHRAYQPLC